MNLIRHEPSPLRYINVSIPKSSLKPLTYSVPDEYPQLSKGMRVLVPLGPRFRTGFVTQTDVEPHQDLTIKPLADVVDAENPFSPVLLKLAEWMAEYYLAKPADILKSALPPGMDIQPMTMIAITSRGEFEEDQHPLLQLLREKKQLPIKEIYHRFGQRGTFSQVRSLQEKGSLQLLAKQPIKRRGYNMVEVIHASDPPEGKKEREIYEYLKRQSGPVWLQDLNDLFPRGSAAIKKMTDRGLLRCYWVPAVPKNVWPELQTVDSLNPAQKKAYEKIRQHADSFGVFLLHGVTGSGKTEVYLRLSQQVLALGKSVLILVPEIALLPLIVHRAQKTLKHPMSVLHSELSERERLEEWQKASRGDVRLVIGTRSAIFAPLKNIGLIVVDEEHDSSYKQKEYPRYHARETAIMRATFEACPIVLGSATPAVESFFNSSNGKYTYLSLPQRVENRPMPSIQLIDMKSEFKETGDYVFSRKLLDQIARRLERKEQILILQNRRGYASVLLCRECGNVLECPRCSVTLTFHKSERRMRCHYCDYSRSAPAKCEKCASTFLHLFGVGTEKIVESFKDLFPNARIERFDRDVTRRRGSIAQILTRFALGEIDILVGTQMLAKGHDFPNVTLVGVVGADSAIGIPDFRASERLFQLLTQVSGRSGRGDEPGNVIIQTFHPNHYAIQCAIEQSYRCFYEKEIRFRRFMQYPPYVALSNIVFSGRNSEKTLEEARKFAKLILVYKTEKMRLMGPAIAPIARLAGESRFQILLKSPSRKQLRQCLNAVMEKFSDQKKLHAQFSVDIDPYSIV